ncbi:MAG: leucine-rich repeat domain-containing protein [Mycoplasmoidaceae bacterium]|nr:leucine-rich repeat domain-containing protein [Mycoplasmoidaceae bacterium]
MNQTTADDFTYDKNGNISGLIGEPNQYDALVIPEAVKGITSNAFQGKFSQSSLGTKMIPLVLHDDIESIGEYAFDNCTNLCSDLHLPTSLTKLGAYAFRDCKNLTGEAEIPTGISTISQQAFSGSGITSLKFHPGVKKLEAKCFASCKNLS